MKTLKISRLVILTVTALLVSGTFGECLAHHTRHAKVCKKRVVRTTHYHKHSPYLKARVVARPAGALKIVVGGVPYYHHHGIFYKKAAHGYVIVSGPVGACLTALPAGYSLVYAGTARYYYRHGTFYRFDRAAGGYLVVTARRAARPCLRCPMAAPRCISTAQSTT